MVALLSIVTLLLSGMGSNAAVSAVALTNGPLIRPAATTAVLNETFESSTLPAGWQVSGAPSWSFNNPGGRANETGGTGNFAIADSDKAGFVQMDAQLRTPALNLSAASTVRLSFKAFFRVDRDSTADVDVSRDNGATWTNIWRQTGATFKGAATLDVPQAAGQSAAMFRFHYYQDALPDAGISEDFERGASEQVSVLDWREDDHIDWPGDPEQAPTPLTVDNVQVPGRIDALYDADVFQK